MIDYYTRLGVKKDATLSQIREAYIKLAKATHPDSASGKTADEFIEIKNAYDTLADPDKRIIYNQTLEVKQEPIKSKVPYLFKFNLPERFEEWDLYNYLNEVFGWEGKERLRPGQTIVRTDRLLSNINQLKSILDNKMRPFKYPMLQSDINGQHEILRQHWIKLSIASSIFCESDEQVKQLYDLSIGAANSEEMKDIERSIGGKSPLIQLIKIDDIIDSSEAIFSLYKAQLLTPQNFAKLIQIAIEDDDDAIDISDGLKTLRIAQLLNQSNFDLLIKNKHYAYEIKKGLSHLERSGIVNQRYFEALVSIGTYAGSVGQILGRLHDLGILNEENYQTVIYKIPHTLVFNQLIDIQKEKAITEKHSEAFHWRGSKELNDLNSALDKLVSHGLFLLSCNVKMGKTAMLLGLDLKKDLKEFYDKPIKQQQALSQELRINFIQKLHFQDDVMTMHRGLWKVLISNILIALTGIGLFAIGINLAVNGQLFFAKTKRAQIQDAIASTFAASHGSQE